MLDEKWFCTKFFLQFLLADTICLKFLILQMLDVLNLCEIDEDEDDMNWHFFELYEIYEHLIPSVIDMVRPLEFIGKVPREDYEVLLSIWKTLRPEEDPEYRERK